MEAKGLENCKGCFRLKLWHPTWCNMELHHESLPNTVSFFVFLQICEPFRCIGFRCGGWFVFDSTASGHRQELPKVVASSPSHEVVKPWSHGRWCFWLLVLHTGIIDLYYLVFIRDSYAPLYWKRSIEAIPANHMSCGNFSIKFCGNCLIIIVIVCSAKTTLSQLF